MTNPIKCRIGAEGLKASHSIKQIVEVVEPHEKITKHCLLNKYLGSEKLRRVAWFLRCIRKSVPESMIY